MFFNIEEAIRFFIQPVSILLENSLNDSHFIKALIRCFDNSGNIQRHLDNNWLQFENAGGCTNIENFINGKLQSFNNLPKLNKQYLRCFVLIDSDKIFPTQQLNSQQRSTRTWLNNQNIPLHILEKRNMETYLPDDNFDSPANSWITCYKRLTPAQKDFLNFDKGFSKKNQDGSPKISREQLDSEVKELYENLNDSDYNILDNGFNLPNFKSDFPKYFDKCTKAGLEQRTDHQANRHELQDIINKLATLI